MSEPDYKAFYDVMMFVVQDWEDLSDEWRGSNEGRALHKVVKTIAALGEVYVTNGTLAHLARKDEA